MEYIINLLMEHQDVKYGDFQAKLIPDLPREQLIGVRTPDLRALAKRIFSEDCCEEFLAELPHKYYEENQLHGFIISMIKDYDETIEKLEAFLPYMNNWATVDQTAPKVFKKNHERLAGELDRWIDSELPYVKRFGIGMVMGHFLDEDFDTKYIDKVTSVHSDHYYVNMEIAWYLATALFKQWEATLPYIESRTLPAWVQNKAIQKARESLRITPEQKAYLNTLKIK